MERQPFNLTLALARADDIRREDNARLRGRPATRGDIEDLERRLTAHKKGKHKSREKFED